MAFKVTLYSIKDEGSTPQYESPLSATLGDNKWMMTKFEKFNVFSDEVIVIPRIDSASDLSKRGKMTDERGVVLDSGCALLQFCEITASDNGDGEGMQPALSSRVAGEEDPRTDPHLCSVLVSDEVMRRYKQAEEKLRKELVVVFLDDNIWYLKSWDSNGLGIVKIHYVECVKDFDSNTGDHSNH
jgi:hypothetical protein